MIRKSPVFGSSVKTAGTAIPARSRSSRSLIIWNKLSVRYAPAKSASVGKHLDDLAGICWVANIDRFTRLVALKDYIFSFIQGFFTSQFLYQCVSKCSVLLLGLDAPEDYSFQRNEVQFFVRQKLEQRSTFRLYDLKIRFERAINLGSPAFGKLRQRLEPPLVLGCHFLACAVAIDRLARNAQHLCQFGCRPAERNLYRAEQLSGTRPGMGGCGRHGLERYANNLTSCALL